MRSNSQVHLPQILLGQRVAASARCSRLLPSYALLQATLHHIHSVADWARGAKAAAALPWRGEGRCICQQDFCGRCGRWRSWAKGKSTSPGELVSIGWRREVQDVPGDGKRMRCITGGRDGTSGAVTTSCDHQLPTQMHREAYNLSP